MNTPTPTKDMSEATSPIRVTIFTLSIVYAKISGVYNISTCMIRAIKLMIPATKRIISPALDFLGETVILHFTSIIILPQYLVSN